MHWNGSERPPTWMVISESSLHAGFYKSCVFTNLGVHFTLIQLHVEQRLIASRRCFSQIVPDGKGGHLKPPSDSLQFVVKCSFRWYQLLYIRHFHTADSSGMTCGWGSNVVFDIWFSRRGIITAFHWDCTWGVSQLWVKKNRLSWESRIWKAWLLESVDVSVITSHSVHVKPSQKDEEKDTSQSEKSPLLSNFRFKEKERKHSCLKFENNNLWISQDWVWCCFHWVKHGACICTAIKELT